MSAASLFSTETFFLDTENGRRFCLYYAPAGTITCHDALIYVAPFGEEMNKSRHMLALQAQALAQSGCAVLLMDLYGCGDSEGELRDASWAQWKADLTSAYHWLTQRSAAPVSLLGLRLGALLCLDVLREKKLLIKRLVMWQPVLHGQQFLTQFFRLKFASDMLAGTTGSAGGTQALRQQLRNGAIIDIAGYEIPPQLAIPLDALSAAQCLPVACPVHWIEIQASAAILAPARQQIVDLFLATGNADSRFTVSSLAGQEFWATPEITVCHALIALTCDIIEQGNTCHA